MKQTRQTQMIPLMEALDKNGLNQSLNQDPLKYAIFYAINFSK